MLPALAMSLLLAVVPGASAQASGKAAPNISKKSATTQPLKVALSLEVVDQYFAIILKNFETEAKAKGVPYIVANGDSGTSPTTQIAAIQDLLVQHPTVLVVAPQSDGIDSILKKAVSEGVKVFEIATNTAQYQLPFLGTNETIGATEMGEWLAKEVSKQGEVGILPSLPGEPTTQERTLPVEKVLTAAGIKWVEASSGDSCLAEQTETNTRTILLANPRITALYSDCGPAAIAMAQALSSRPAGSKKVLCAGFDAEMQQIQQILAGTCTAALAQLPAQTGIEAVEWAIKVANGVKMPANVNTGVALITKANASCWYDKGDGYSYPLPCAHIAS
jgi:ribose transport system substrate-binding protein